MVGDLVNYLVWMGEPAQLQRKKLGLMVLAFLRNLLRGGLLPEERVLERHSLNPVTPLANSRTVSGCWRFKH